MSHHSTTHHHNTIHHDPSTHQVEAPTPPRIPKQKIPVIVLAVLGLILITVGAAWFMNGQSFNFGKNDGDSITYAPIDEAVIATVGAENIYGEDLKYKKSQTPENLMTPELEAELFQRLIDESIILQAGAEESYVELNSSVFNNPLKDQQARQRLITQVTEKVDQNASYKKGAFVSIWFMNDTPGPVGYEAGQQIALEKITAVHQAVTNGTMSIKQAGDTLKNDSALAQVDPTSYQSNAYTEFNTLETSAISFDPGFDEEIVALDQGETTDIYLAKDHPASDPNLPLQDAVYMFGQVTETKSDGLEAFPTWLESQRNNYEVVKN